MSSQTSGVSEKPSKAWYLLPIFLGFIGGLIAFFAIKDKDGKMAKNGLVLGILMWVIALVVSFFVPFPYSLFVFIAALIWLGFYRNA